MKTPYMHPESDFTITVSKETHYYPFGLTMSGISSKAAGKIENKKKFNGYEFNNDFDINLYESFYRTNDPQLGRFWQIDPKAIDEISPYASMSNNPILNVDVLGDTTTYYDSKGNTLYTTYVEGYNNAFIIGDKYLAAAKAEFDKLDNNLTLAQQKSIDDAILAVNSIFEIGDAYDLHSISKFFNDNANKHNILKIDNIPIDDMDFVKVGDKIISKAQIKKMKGAEANFEMVKVNGVWKVDKKSTATMNNFNGTNPGSGSSPNGHLHPYVREWAGKYLSYKYQGKMYNVGKVLASGRPSEPDIEYARLQGKTNSSTVRNVVVTSNRIYLHTNNYDYQISIAR